MNEIINTDSLLKDQPRQPSLGTNSFNFSQKERGQTTANNFIDRQKETLIREYIPNRETLLGLANFFSILGDSTRIKLLSALSISPLCVTDIAKTLGMNQTTISHQLRTMRDNGLVDFERRGKVLMYYIKESKVLDIMLKAVDMI